MKIIGSVGSFSIVNILRQVTGELLIDSSSVLLWRNCIKVSMNIAVSVRKYVSKPAKRLKVGNKMESRRLPDKDSNWTKTLSSTSPVFFFIFDLAFSSTYASLSWFLFWYGKDWSSFVFLKFQFFPGSSNHFYKEDVKNNCIVLHPPSQDNVTRQWIALAIFNGIASLTNCRVFQRNNG